MDDATAYFTSGTTCQWAMWTGDVSNMFDEISHAEILMAVAWALNNDIVAAWSGKRSVDRFSVARHSKAAHIGTNYTDGEFVTITMTLHCHLRSYSISDSASLTSVMHSYVNVRH